MSKQKKGPLLFTGQHPAAANFAKEKQKKPRKPKTLLDYDMRRANELGYGPHYGKYKADHPNTRAEFEALTEKKKTTPNPKAVTCPICGVIFVKTKNPNQKYCSPECLAQAQSEQTKRAWAKRPRPGTLLVCPICGEEFVSRGGRKYCTPECRVKGDRQNAARLREKYRQERKNNGSI